MPKDNFLNRFPVIKHLIIMLAISIIILVAAFMLIKVYARHDQAFALPDLTGLYPGELDVEVECIVIDSLYQSGTAGGVILSHIPRAGTLVKPDRKVYVTIASLQQENVFVPDILNSSLPSAVSRVMNSGLHVGSISFIDSDSTMELRSPMVSSIHYKGKTLVPGDEISQGSRLDLVVQNPSNRTSGKIPFLLGKEAVAAQRSTLASAFNVKLHYKDNVKDKEKAVVYEQEPVYTGVSQYAYGTVVELWLCNPDEIDVKQLIREFKVDSSKIIYPDNYESDSLTDGISEEEFIIDNEGWWR